MPSWQDREITLLDLTTHTSGLPRLPDNLRPADIDDPYADYTVDDLYEFLSSHELRRAPEVEAEYSNLAVGLLGHALARAADTPYAELVQERVLAPLGMQMSGLDLEGERGRWMVRGHRAGAVVPYWFATEAIAGAGALRSNVDDMLAYLEANVRAATLPADSLSDLERAMRLAHRPRRPFLEEQDVWSGLGWRIATVEGRTIVEHGGGTGGFSTHLAFEPETGAGYVMLTNTSQFRDDLGRDLLTRGRPIELDEVTPSPDALAAWPGRYLMDGDRPLYIRAESEGYLTVQSSNNVRFRLYADSDSTFFAKRSPRRLTFRTTADGTPELSGDFNGTHRVGLRADDKVPPPAVVAGNDGIGFRITQLLRSVLLRLSLWRPIHWLMAGGVVVGALGWAALATLRYVQGQLRARRV